MFGENKNRKMQVREGRQGTESNKATPAEEEGHTGSGQISTRTAPAGTTHKCDLIRDL